MAFFRGFHNPFTRNHSAQPDEAPVHIEASEGLYEPEDRSVGYELDTPPVYRDCPYLVVGYFAEEKTLSVSGIPTSPEQGRLIHYVFVHSMRGLTTHNKDKYGVVHASRPFRDNDSKMDTGESSASALGMGFLAHGIPEVDVFFVYPTEKQCWWKLTRDKDTGTCSVFPFTPSEEDSADTEGSISVGRFRRMFRE